MKHIQKHIKNLGRTIKSITMTNLRLGLLCVVLSCVPATISIQYTSIVETTSGPIRGKQVEEFGVTYHSYQGIPYAEKPIGPLRFKAPEPMSPWTEVLNAMKEGFICPQSGNTYKKEQMSEDCLFLNVYIPIGKDTSNSQLPVLVYIHGGEFKSRSSSAEDQYGPQLLLKKEIIVVTLNYRIGALGFLSLGTEEVPGNAGLKDILLGLTWVNKNIAQFGGNPNKITIGGNSAGAIAAHYLLLTTKTTGLLHQAILISGSATGYRFLARRPKDDAVKLGKQLGSQTNDTRELLKILTDADAFDIVQAQEDMGSDDTRKGFRPHAPFVPCAEAEHKDALITLDPKLIVKSGIPQNVPLLVGFNKDEGLKMYDPVSKNKTLADLLNENFERCIPTDIEYPLGSSESKDLAFAIREFYFNGGNINNDTMDEFIRMITDTMFAYSVDSWIKLHEHRQCSKDVFYYVFGFDGELNWAKINSKIDYPGTAHADELGYIFVTNKTKSRLNNLDQRSQKMVNTMTTILSNFVKYGNPTPTINDIGVIWRKSNGRRHHLLINDHLKNLWSSPYKHNLKFWYTVYEHYYLY